MVFKIVTTAFPQTTCICFADNWALIADDPTTVCDGLRLLQELTTAFRLTISTSKSWLWGTSSSFRKSLSTASFNGDRIPVVWNAVDLGVEQCYTKKRSTKLLTKRAAKTVAKLKVIKKSKLPRGCRKRIATSAALACQTYGTATHQAPRAMMHNVRVQFARALNRDGAGCSAWLACNAFDHCLDPELRAVFQRVLVWQRFSRLFPDEMIGLQQHCKDIQHKPRLHTKPGPVAAFVAGLCRLGATFGDDPGTFHLDGWLVNWQTIAKKPLLRLLEDAWIRVVCQQCTTRKNFAITSFDISGSSKVHAEFSFEDRPYVESAMIGKHYTGDFLSKFLPAVSGECPLCGEPDSRKRRIFHCKVLEPFRTKKAALKRIAKWEEAHWFYTLCPPIPPVTDALQQFASGAILRQLPPEDPQVHHVFTDGSGFFGDEPKLTLAAGAFAELPYLQTTIVQSGGAPVPGIEQHSYLGEAFAIYLALLQFWTVHFYSDCQGICDTVTMILACRDDQVPDARVQTPLWQTIIWMLKRRPAGCVQVTKVKAHTSAQGVVDQFQRWLIWGNAAADQRAKDVIQSDWKRVYDKVSKAYKQCMVQRDDLRVLLHLVIAANKKCAEKSTESTCRMKKQFRVDYNHRAFQCPAVSRRSLYTLAGIAI